MSDHQNQQAVEDELKALREANRKLEKQYAVLERSHKTLDGLVDDLPVPFICLDTRLVVTNWNPAAERLFGYAPEDVVGISLIELIVPTDERQKATDLLWTQLRKFAPHAKQLQNNNKDGDIIYGEWHLTTILDDSQEPQGIKLIIIDQSAGTSAFGRLRELEKRFDSVFSLAPIGIFRADLEGQFISVNPEFAWMLGYESPKALTHQLTDMAEQMFANEAQREDFFFYLFEQEQLNNFRIQVLRKDGTTFWAMSNAQVVRNEAGRQFCIDGFLMDINNLVRIENELRKARAIAEAATESKSRFLANMSHEIRTPMNAIIGFTDLTLKTDLSEKQQDYLNKIAVSAQALLGLINDILDLSKIEAGKLDLDNVDFMLYALMDNLNDMFANRVNEKGINLLISVAQDIPTALVGDSLRLGQVLINLINNAIKFTDQGEVVVWVSRVKQEADRIWLQFSVSDTGIGISEAQINRLFTSFSQADSSTTRKYGGTGLGLAISKQLVEMMGGEIWVASEHQKGSTFAFTVELGVQSLDKAHKHELPEQLQGIRVLVVDANAASREVLMLLLISYACEVEVVSSAEEAIYELRRAWQAGKAYDLAFIDWLLPKSDSIETIRAIRTWEQKLPLVTSHQADSPQSKAGDLPVILMIAFGQEDIQQRAEEAGATDFLSKPVKQLYLFHMLLKVFGLEHLIPQEKATLDEKVKETFDDLAGVGVLLVEDIKINQLVATELLKSQGIVVTVAENGRDAVEKVRNLPFDAVLMDIQMPELDGYEATRIIRQEKRFRDLPIIAMTAHAMVDEREKCLEAGMNDHLTKPIVPRLLFTCLRNWIPEEVRSAVAARAVAREPVPEADNDPFPESLIGIDITSGLEKVAHNKKLYVELLLDFRRTYCQATAEITAAIDAGNMEKARYLVHTIKSVSGNLGANTLSGLANKLEAAILQQNMANCNELIKQVAVVLDTVFDSIDNFEKMIVKPADDQSRRMPSNGTVDLGKVFQYLETLYALLETDMTGALDHFQKFREDFCDAVFWEKFAELEHHLNQFDTDAASASIKKIIKELNNA